MGGDPHIQLKRGGKGSRKKWAGTRIIKTGAERNGGQREGRTKMESNPLAAGGKRGKRKPKGPKKGAKFFEPVRNFSISWRKKGGCAADCLRRLLRNSAPVGRGKNGVTGKTR